MRRRRGDRPRGCILRLQGPQRPFRILHPVSYKGHFIFCSRGAFNNISGICPSPNFPSPRLPVRVVQPDEPRASSSARASSRLSRGRIARRESSAGERERTL